MFVLFTCIVRAYNRIPLEFSADKVSEYDKSKMFKLSQFKHYQYDNVSHCLLVEYKPGDKAFADELETLRNRFNNKPKEDISSLLVDPKNDLTDEEKFAIFIYSVGSTIYRDLTIQLATGYTGKFDCYVDYLDKAFQKMKPLQSKISLYRGTSEDNLNQVNTKLEFFKKGTYVSASSFTSSSSEFHTGLSFAFWSTGDSNILFNITSCRNPRNITRLSGKPNENEYLIPPCSRFKVIKDQYKLWCNYKTEETVVCKSTPETALNYHEYTFIDLEEVDDDYGPFSYVERPEQTPIPTKSTAPTKNEGGGSSSNNDNDINERFSSQLLGNIQIGSVYLGASKIIWLDFGYKLMNVARKALGKLIPPPDFLHSAIWVGTQNPTDESLGAIFVYGRYNPNGNDQTFLLEDGARSYVMTLKEFKEKYNSFGVKKLNPQKRLYLFDFIEAIKSSGNWRSKYYNWPTNNCQHFSAKCISLLKATRDTINDNDWENLPSTILNTLKLNEINKIN